MSIEEAVEQPRRGGRPARGKRGTFTFRVSDQLRNKLELAAAEAKRPVSEEIEARLERSFSDQDIILRTLSASKKYAKLLEMIGFVGLVAQRRTDKDIDTDDETFEVAIRAAQLLLSINTALKT